MHVENEPVGEQFIYLSAYNKKSNYFTVHVENEGYNSFVINTKGATVSGTDTNGNPWERAIKSKGNLTVKADKTGNVKLYVNGSKLSNCDIDNTTMTFNFTYCGATCTAVITANSAYYQIAGEDETHEFLDWYDDDEE